MAIFASDDNIDFGGTVQITCRQACEGISCLRIEYEAMQ